MEFLTHDQMGVRFAELRERRGLGTADVATAAGLEPAELAAFEAGERGIAGAELEAVARALGVPVDALLFAQEPVVPLYRNEGGDEAAGRAEAEFSAVMDDFFTFEAAVRR